MLEMRGFTIIHGKNFDRLVEIGKVYNDAECPLAFFDGCERF